MAEWKPISEYPKSAERPPLVLARCNRFSNQTEHYLVVFREGHFYICPGVPLFYGFHQLGFTTADHVEEFMEIPA